MPAYEGIKKAILPCLLALAFAAGALAACAPATPNSPPQVAGAGPTAVAAGQAIRPVASAAPGAEVPAIKQQIVDIHRDMLRVLQQLARLDPERQQQVSELMVNLMAEVSRLMALMQPVADRLTPEERQAATGNMGRIRADIEDMYRLMPGVATRPMMNPSRTPTPGGMDQSDLPSLSQMGQQMDELHRQMRVRVREMDLEKAQGMAANMVDLSGNMDRLRDVLGPALSRVSPEQRLALSQQMDRMLVITRQMVQVAGSTPGTP